MLIYNHKKEFIGIDKNYLEIFNVKNLTELQTLNENFADFFVKSPGHIHNFIHVHWIDYILCNETGVLSKVLININDINYSANIDIKVIFLTNEPSQPAYLINLLNIKSLDSDLHEQSACDINNSFDPLTISYDEKLIKDIQESVIEKPIILDDLSQEVNLEIKIVEDIQDTDSYTAYKFDPEIASNELGLPVDLVIEFVQDFITQANSFKEDLYNSISYSDNNNIKTLSHKLKGVSANLRIQDAHDILNIINQSEDFSQIKKDIDTFYEIITKLSNEHPLDDIVLNFKEKE